MVAMKLPLANESVQERVTNRLQYLWYNKGTDFFYKVGFCPSWGTPYLRWSPCFFPGSEKIPLFTPTLSCNNNPYFSENEEFCCHKRTLFPDFKEWMFDGEIHFKDTEEMCLAQLSSFFHKSPYLKISRSPSQQNVIKYINWILTHRRPAKRAFYFQDSGLQQYLASGSWVDLV